MKPSITFSVILAGLFFVNSPELEAQQPLHQRIDAAVADQQPVSTQLLASDSEFMRRLYLDLLGTVPTLEEAKTVAP